MHDNLNANEKEQMKKEDNKRKKKGMINSTIIKKQLRKFKKEGKKVRCDNPNANEKRGQQKKKRKA